MCQDYKTTRITFKESCYEVYIKRSDFHSFTVSPCFDATKVSGGESVFVVRRILTDSPRFLVPGLHQPSPIQTNPIPGISGKESGGCNLGPRAVGLKLERCPWVSVTNQGSPSKGLGSS